MSRRQLMLIKNQKGMLTLDFIFASVLFFAFSSILFSFSMTFSVVEVVQYISFASARNFSLAHSNPSIQEERGQRKYSQLIAHPAIAPMISNGWYSLQPILIGQFDELANPKDRQEDSMIFTGARIPFSAPILYKNFPLLGSTASDPDGFFAYIQSFTSREPAQTECFQFTGQRMEAIINLGYEGRVDRYTNHSDNGC